MKHHRSLLSTLILSALAFSLTACGDGPGDDDEQTPPAGDVAAFKYDVLTLNVGGGEKLEVSLNGLPLEAVKGADKVEGTTWEVVERRGVRFSKILEKAGITGDDSMPVNLIGRDGFDPLRTRIKDTAKLPRLDFMRAHAYVYAGDPGSKDPLYPEVGAHSLIVDYDLESDADVPAYLGGSIASLSLMRMRMMEKVDLAEFGEEGGVAQGLVEIAPGYEAQ
jgi:hypothetical protein